MSERPRWLTETARSSPTGEALETPEVRPPEVRPPERRGPGRRGPGRRSRPRSAASARSTKTGYATDPPRARFERRAAAVRRRPLRLLAVAAGLVVLLAAAGWLIGFSSVLSAREVSVTGLSDAGEQQAVLAAAAVPLGDPLARIDTAGAAERVSRIPTVASVTVSRSWPSTVVLSVQRKVPVAAVKDPQGQLQVVDASGVPFETVSSLPAGVVLVESTGDAAAGTTAASPDPVGVRTAVGVLQVLSPARRATLTRISVSSADLVTLQLGTVTVVWGTADEGATKLAVPEALLPTKPSLVDVSAPDTPITR